MNRTPTILRITLAFALATAGCGRSIACVRADAVRTTASCVEEKLNKGDEISVRTSDGTRHDGHFVEILDAPDSLALVMSEFSPRSGREPVKVFLNLAAIDSVYEERGTPIPGPLRPLVAVAGIAASAVMVLAVIMIISSPDISFGD